MKAIVIKARGEKSQFFGLTFRVTGFSIQGAMSLTVNGDEVWFAPGEALICDLDEQFRQLIENPVDGEDKMMIALNVYKTAFEIKL